MEIEFKSTRKNKLFSELVAGDTFLFREELWIKTDKESCATSLYDGSLGSPFGDHDGPLEVFHGKIVEL